TVHLHEALRLQHAAAGDSRLRNRWCCPRDGDVLAGLPDGRSNVVTGVANVGPKRRLDDDDWLTFGVDVALRERDHTKACKSRQHRAGQVCSCLVDTERAGLALRIAALEPHG